MEIPFLPLQIFSCTLALRHGVKSARTSTHRDAESARTAARRVPGCATCVFIVPAAAVPLLCVVPGHATLVPTPHTGPCAAWTARCHLCSSSNFAPRFHCLSSIFVESHDLSPLKWDLSQSVVRTFYRIAHANAPIQCSRCRLHRTGGRVPRAWNYANLGRRSSGSAARPVPHASGHET
ncbi:hypothetical protein HAX54_049960, partial [Datura stramonium]|nr:hypothetical protein [Datura stramonium]